MKLLRLKAVIEITGLSRSTIYKYMANGAFPKSILIGERASAWLESDIQQWLNEKIEIRDSN